MKKKIASSNCLGVPRSKGELVLITEASDVGGGGTIYQWQELNPAELTHCLRRLKLHGQNLPKRASPRHSEKIVFMGDPTKQEPQIQRKSINWTIFFYFQENPLPRKIIYLPKNALLFFGKP